ncbi:MAG: 4Fe-4S dicluster domain-containing protein [Deltaproteobacteria bacterium]|nr:4Fe-4S dicluster domain-containing protein [Deltaproteobacteria bacterium]
MAFSIFLYASLIIFFIGLIYKIASWFSKNVGLMGRDVTTGQKVSSVIRGIFGVFFSHKILSLIIVFILDVIFQRKILRENVLRWVMHMLIYAGFILLLLMHALGEIITASFFEEYYSTLNPFLFLRSLFGVLVIVGLLMALCRRYILKIPRLRTGPMDSYAIAILAVIMISGVLLEGAKITSYREFLIMAEEYGGLSEGEEEFTALESYWVEEFGVVSPNVKGPFYENVLEEGREVHESNCMGCHASPQWAFPGYITAKIIKPIALRIDRLRGPQILWYIHILACFFGLAYLPFSKMFHIIATPISLLANAVMDRDRSRPANIATRQAMELDACMQCGTCSLMCSSSMAFDVIGNDYILPSQKMKFLKQMYAGNSLGPKELRAIQEGIYVCTNCDRCTVVCPAGIRLKELWLDVREDLIQRKGPAPWVLSHYSFFRGLNRDALQQKADYPRPLEMMEQALKKPVEPLMNGSVPLVLGKADPVKDRMVFHQDTFKYCFACQNCTTVCPVVDACENPETALDLMPHQIMCSLGMGLVEIAAGTRMLWDCVTCYQCQEHCPQKVRVTDVLFELKNMAIKNMG